MKNNRIYLFLVLLLVALNIVQLVLKLNTNDTQRTYENVMRESGKVYVVYAVIGVILIGLFIYLFSLDRKVQQLEDRTRDKQ